MSIYSVVQKSQLEGADRLDAQYYQPEYLEIMKTLVDLGICKKLEDISKSLESFGAYALTSNIVWRDEGIPFLEANNIKDGIISYEGVRYIDDNVDKILRKSKVSEGQVLLSMSGSVGNAAVASSVPAKLNSNQDIVKITTESKISPYYLAAFLNSKYGKMQVLRLPVGSVQQHIFLWQTKSILVPVFSQEIQSQIEGLYKSSLKELENSAACYEQAEDLLLGELELKDFQIPEDLSYIVNYSDAEKVDRVDADYFQPKYDELISKINNQNAKSLLEVVQNVPARFVPKPDESYKYVELANINSSVGVVDGYSEVLGKEAPSRARRLLKTGDVLVSSIQGSLGKTALVDTDQNGSLASTGFFQLRSSEILSEVLLVFAKSIILQWQLERECAGTILSAVPQESLKRLIIPILPRSTQQKIADLVKKSHEARKKSKEQLDEAKRKVEEMIEKGGE